MQEIEIMTKREALRQTQQENTLLELGFTRAEAEQLRRISMTLQRWFEHECNGAIQRDETTDKPYWYNGYRNGAYASHYPIPDRENGALRRLQAIIDARNKREAEYDEQRRTTNPDYQQPVSSFIQSDPRGAALYIIRPGDVPDGKDVQAYYTRGVCVY